VLLRRMMRLPVALVGVAAELLVDLDSVVLGSEGAEAVLLSLPVQPRKVARRQHHSARVHFPREGKRRLWIRVGESGWSNREELEYGSIWNIPAR
jgi:hypothetical protein